jgi:CheY-like chemotaxis protein
MVSSHLKKNNLVLYYNIDKDISRYLVAEYKPLKETLEELMIFFAKSTSHGEITLSIKKNKEKSLIFKISNESRIIHTHLDIEAPTITHQDIYNDLNFHISEKGNMDCEFSISFIEDSNQKSYTETLKQLLTGKKALFVGNHKNEVKIAQSIFENYGISIDHITTEVFKQKKPDFDLYNMVILRSADLTMAKMNIFKNIIQSQKNLKIIMMHDTFVTRDVRKKSLSIAHAEIFRPTIIGDIEEIFRKLYIDDEVLNTQHCNENIQRLDLFRILENNALQKEDLEKFVGCKILILNHNKLQLKMIQNILDINGIFIYTAETLQEAMEVLRTRRIDIIFAEIDLSLKECFDFIQEIKQNVNCNHIPLISISSYAFDHELIKMMEQGIKGHISIPYKASHIYNAMHHQLDEIYA